MVECTEWRDILSFLSLTTTRYVEETASKNNNKNQDYKRQKRLSIAYVKL